MVAVSASASASASAATPTIHNKTHPAIMEPSPIVDISRSPRNPPKKSKANSKSRSHRRRSSSTSSDSSSRSSWSLHSSDPEPNEDDNNDVVAYTCFPCRRAFATAASLASHLTSKAHMKRTMAAGTVSVDEPQAQEAEPPTQSSAAEASVGRDDNNDNDDQVFCPFCLDPLDASNPTSVHSHLAAKHSFHIPHAHAVADLAGLLMYLETKIHDLGHCLHCHAVYWNPNYTTGDDEQAEEEEKELPEMRDEFRSGQDAIKHMSARGHNAMRVESGAWREYAAFYDDECAAEVFANRPATPASVVPSSSSSSVARFVSGARRPPLARPSTLASITDSSASSSSPSSRVRAVVRAGDSHALAQDLALHHSIPVYQAAKLARSGTAAHALTAMSTSDIRHLAKTLEQAESSTRRAQMREYAAQAVKANKSDRKRVASGVFIVLK